MSQIQLAWVKFSLTFIAFMAIFLAGVYWQVSSLPNVTRAEVKEHWAAQKLRDEELKKTCAALLVQIKQNDREILRLRAKAKE